MSSVQSQNYILESNNYECFSYTKKYLSEIARCDCDVVAIAAKISIIVLPLILLVTLVLDTLAYICRGQPATSVNNGNTTSNSTTSGNGGTIPSSSGAAPVAEPITEVVPYQPQYKFQCAERIAGLSPTSELCLRLQNSYGDAFIETCARSFVGGSTSLSFRNGVLSGPPNLLNVIINDILGLELECRSTMALGPNTQRELVSKIVYQLLPVDARKLVAKEVYTTLSSYLKEGEHPIQISLLMTYQGQPLYLSKRNGDLVITRCAPTYSHNNGSFVELPDVSGISIKNDGTVQFSNPSLTDINSALLSLLFARLDLVIFSLDATKVQLLPPKLLKQCLKVADQLKPAYQQCLDQQELRLLLPINISINLPIQQSNLPPIQAVPLSTRPASKSLIIGEFANPLMSSQDSAFTLIVGEDGSFAIRKFSGRGHMGGHMERQVVFKKVDERTMQCFIIKSSYQDIFIGSVEEKSEASYKVSINGNGQLTMEDGRKLEGVQEDTRGVYVLGEQGWRCAGGLNTVLNAKTTEDAEKDLNFVLQCLCTFDALISDPHTIACGTSVDRIPVHFATGLPASHLYLVNNPIKINQGGLQGSYGVIKHNNWGQLVFKRTLLNPALRLPSAES